MLSVLNVTHRFPTVEVLQEVSFELAPGRIGCLLGPSGCGKTTVLRCISGFERIAAGEIRVQGELLSGDGVHVAASKRRIGMVFQDYALMPHLTVGQNVGFGLEKLDSAAQRLRIGEMLELVGLEREQQRLPHELSGGQQQRVAIARALAQRPRLLLMDEPFSNLDAGLRRRLGSELRDLLKAAGATVLLVTHDHYDALALADDLGVLSGGKLLQWTNAYDVYHRPATRFVADFVGQGAWLPGTVRGADAIELEIGVAEGQLTNPFPDGASVDLLLRPDDVIHDDRSEVSAEVVARRFRGSRFMYELRLESGAVIYSSVPSHHDHPVSSRIGIRLETDHLVAFSRRVKP